jgi:Protein of unknown function (DUF3455)
MTGKRTLLLSVLIACAAPLTDGAAEPPGTAIELLARGVQIYTCTATPTGAAWKLKAPEATLRDASGRVVGQHFAGPTWQGTDGSKVVGSPLVASTAVESGAVPWLVLRATETSGAGLFAHVAYIARTRTTGGTARPTGCDPAHQGAESRVPYSATYTFFPATAP